MVALIGSSQGWGAHHLPRQSPGWHRHSSGWGLRLTSRRARSQRLEVERHRDHWLIVLSCQPRALHLTVNQEMQLVRRVTG